MKPFMRSQLERYSQRLEELNFLLSREDIMKDMSQFMSLSKEHADVSAVSAPFERWKQRLSDKAEAQSMLEAEQATLPNSAQDSESNEMLEMAREEIAVAEAEIEQLEAQLQRMLLPKDPDDVRPAYLEIRAGTGGDESALFAADLLRMYTRFAERMGWKIELMSESQSELGGYRVVSYTHLTLPTILRV